MAFLNRIRQTIASLFCPQRETSDQLGPRAEDASDQLNFSRSASQSTNASVSSYATYLHRVDDNAAEMFPAPILPDRKRKRDAQLYDDSGYRYGEYSTDSLDEASLPDDYEEHYFKRPRTADNIALQDPDQDAPSELSSFDDDPSSFDSTRISSEDTREVPLDTDESHFESSEVDCELEYDDSISNATESDSRSVASSSSPLSTTSEISRVNDYDSVSSFRDDFVKVESAESEIYEVEISEDEDQSGHTDQNPEEYSSDSDIEQENSVETKEQDADEAKFKFDLEKAKRWAHAVKLPLGQWADAERDLYFRLAMRGFEPLIPSNWKSDFMTLPESLFSSQDADDAIIRSMSDRDFRAIKSLSDLFCLGRQVRDKLLATLRPEPVIKRSIRRYIGWAMKDAGLHNRPNVIPLYVIYGARAHQSTKETLEVLSARLAALATRYQESWKLAPSIETEYEDTGNSGQQYADRTFPVLTGFLICGTIVALITLNSDPKACPTPEFEAKPRLIGKFDFGERGDDVWNALALAIAVNRVRKTMLHLEEEGQGEVMWMEGHSEMGDTDA